MFFHDPFVSIRTPTPLGTRKQICGALRNAVGMNEVEKANRFISVLIDTMFWGGQNRPIFYVTQESDIPSIPRGRWMGDFFPMDLPEAPGILKNFPMPVVGFGFLALGVRPGEMIQVQHETPQKEKANEPATEVSPVPQDGAVLPD